LGNRRHPRYNEPGVIEFPGKTERLLEVMERLLGYSIRIINAVPGYVGIKVLSFGLNKWDVQPDYFDWETDDTLGMECSGIVYKVGAGIHDITVGDRVACFGTGTCFPIKIVWLNIPFI
jgi:NADPH:quinone reductase-like Zn-dependent oxidoreductase